MPRKLRPEPAPSVKAPASNQHAARIRSLDEGWRAAAARRDLDGMMGIYAPDAQELLPDVPPLVGRDAIRGFYQSLIKQLPRFAQHFDPQDITVAASGDLAVVRGTYRFTPDTARPREIHTGKFVGVWRFRDGDWRLQVNISNSDPPARG
jgi:uncharacterized protein (TIGR02246 family)